MSSIVPRTQLADEQLARLNKANCRLSVYMGAERMGWSVLDTIHRRVVSVTDFIIREKFAADGWKEAVKLLADYEPGLQAFGSVKIAIDFGKSVLVPQELFAESQIRTYLDFAIAQPGEPATDFIKSIPACSTYGIPVGLSESFSGVADKYSIVHISTPFIENVIAENRNSDESGIYGSLAGSTLHLAALDGGKFVFYNAFPVRTKEDFIYFLMAVTEELNFHPEQINISVSGDITPDSDYYQAAKRFLKRLSLAERPKALKYSAKLDNVPRHRFALLYSIHLCE